jgi:hypothetical protein
VKLFDYSNTDTFSTALFLEELKNLYFWIVSLPTLLAATKKQIAFRFVSRLITFN